MGLEKSNPLKKTYDKTLSMLNFSGGTGWLPATSCLFILQMSIFFKKHRNPSNSSKCPSEQWPPIGGRLFFSKSLIDMHVVEASGGVSRTSKQIEAIPNDGPQGKHLWVSDFPYFPNPLNPQEKWAFICWNDLVEMRFDRLGIDFYTTRSEW